MSDEIVVVTRCRRCGQDKPADHRDAHLCVDCVKAENNRYNHLRMNQGDWMAAAKDAGVDVWLQQPGETQWEYTVWCAFRDAYPGKKPTYTDVAVQLGTTSGVVRKIAQRWQFTARMQEWMAEVNRITMAQRRAEILNMNADHIDMARRLRDKLSTAIDNVDPYNLTPSEINSLMRTATELERKAQIDSAAQEQLVVAAGDDEESPDVKKSPTKQDDLGEVINILLKAGALGTVTQIGVKETTTREVVARNADGDEARLLQEE